jgi:hypothetical protein
MASTDNAVVEQSTQDSKYERLKLAKNHNERKS